MLKKINIVPRWIIFLLDIGVTCFSFLLALILQKNLVLSSLQLEPVLNTFILLTISNLLVFASVKTYSGIVRYTGMQDAVRILVAVFLSSALLLLVSKATEGSANTFVLDNVVGTVNILNYARQIKNLERFVYFSTDEIFGNAPNKVSYKEYDRYNSTNPYSASKAAAEEFCVAYENTYKLPIFITHTIKIDFACIYTYI